MTGFQKAFTVCAWVNPWHTGNTFGTWFSYFGAPNAYDEIVITDRLNYLHEIFNLAVGGSTMLVRGSWTHQCMVWDFATLKADTYLAGQKVVSKGTPSGRTLIAGGNIVLGQDQDSLGGGFAANEAFGGELYQLNMWNRSLEAEEIAGMAKDGLCGSLEDDLAEEITLPWQHFLDAQRFHLL